MSEYAVMPMEDYQAICDAVREKTGGTEVLKSGEVGGVIEQVYTANELVKVRDCRYMFHNCSALVTVPQLDTSSGTDFGNMFYGCSKLTAVSQLDTSSGTNFANMFRGCSALVTVPQLDTSSGTNFGSMFYGCSALATAPQLNTSSGTNFAGMFSDCSKLTAVPQLDTSSGTDFGNMFYGCSKLTAVPQLDTSLSTSCTYMFRNCYALTTVPQLDFRLVTGVSSIFQNCYALSECRIRNIKVSITVGSGTSYGHLLTVDSLVYLINELRDTGTVKTLTVGSANLEKLASVYVKTVEITDEMRAEDDLIDEKLPCVVCDSADEGATLITEYVKLKHWIIK